MKKGGPKPASRLHRIILVFFMLAGLIEGGVGSFLYFRHQGLWVPLPQATQNPSPAELKNPQRLIIPKLKIEASLIGVGTDSEGKMTMPEDPQTIVWFEKGAKLGEMGSVVVAGHLDSKTGPAIFYYLDRLEVNDKIEVFDENGQKYDFVVAAKETFDESSFPTQKVFGADDKQRLNLITCQGKFNPLTQTYDKRIVVFTERENYNYADEIEF